MVSINCIYCAKPFDPTRGEGDHVLSSALFGEFRYDVRFRGCCNACNNSFGIHEQILAQATPLGFLRAIVKPVQTRRHSSRRQRGAKGSKPPRFIAYADDHGELVVPQIDDPRNVEPIDRLTIQADDGTEHYLRLFRGMSTERLRSDIERTRCNNIKHIFCSCEPDNVEFYKQLLRKLYPNHQWEDRPDTEVGARMVRGRTEFIFSTDAFRALAKIAFHYYLVHNRRGYRGDEPEFHAIRQYIRNGIGNHELFFDLPGPTFAVPFGETIPGRGTTPGNWSHILSAHEVDENIVVNLRLFAGPGFEGEVHQITLGKIQSRIVLPSGFWGHVYHYDLLTDDRYSGFVEQARLQRLA
jgi:hypothetical protein